MGGLGCRSLAPFQQGDRSCEEGLGLLGGQAAASNLGLTQNNPRGIVLLKGGPVQDFTFGWPVPLTFKKSLELSVQVAEAGVLQIVANIIRGTSG
jgi:hypothetical protein